MTTQEKNNEQLRYSYADYLTWPEDIMQEIIDGTIYLYPAPLRIHAATIGALLFKIGSFIRKRKSNCQVYTLPFDVRLPLNGETDDDKIYNVVQPDISVIYDTTKLDDRGCIGAPDLIVEVTSPNTNIRDMNHKFLLYEKVGVCEYWVVYPKDKGVTVFLLQPNGKYDEGTTYEVVRETTKIAVQTLKWLVIDLEELFGED
jgi:Uma2 family endonuclease